MKFYVYMKNMSMLFGGFKLLQCTCYAFYFSTFSELVFMNDDILTGCSQDNGQRFSTDSTVHQKVHDNESEHTGGVSETSDSEIY